MSQNPKFCYALVLSSSTPEFEFLRLYSQLQNVHLAYKQHEDVKSKRKFIFIYIEDYKSFLQEADNLNFEKQKTSKKTLSNDYIDGLTHDKYYFFLKKRETLAPYIKSLETSSCFKYRIRHKFLPNGFDLNDYEGVANHLFEPQEKIRTVLWMLNKMEIDGQDHQSHNLLQSFRQQGFLLDFYPLHDYNQPVHQSNYYNDSYIKKYFGESVAIYFNFLDYLQKWLSAPVIIGLLVGLMNYLFQASVDKSPYDSFYSLFIIVWSNLFVVFWLKKQKEIAFKWKCFGKSLETQESVQHVPQTFHERVNDVTGLTEQFYPTYKRFAKYLFSFVVTLPILSLTFFVLVISLNLRGFVDPKHSGIYLETFSKLSWEGGIFDKKSNRMLLPTILHVVVIVILNKLYKSISEWTSQQENHKTYLGYQNSLIVKRFIFEMFYAFTDFIYIGFIQRDIGGLKKALLALFMIDEFRRVIMETIIPLIQKKASFKKKDDKQEKSEDISGNNNKELEEKVKECSMNCYEAFDDYLEVVINFGYVTLFAAAMPIAPLFIFLFHYIESYSDRYKLFNLYRRPSPSRANSIGSWFAVINIMSLLSVLTNIFLFSFSSAKIQQVFGLENNEEFLHYVLILVFVLEHILFVIIWIARKIVVAKEDWTDIYWNRKLYKQKIRKLKMISSDLGQSTVVAAK